MSRMSAEPTANEPWTVGRLLTWTTDFLRGKGADTPRLDAEVLLAHARRCQRIELYTAFDEVPPESVRTAYRDLVSRRAKGTPVAYLVGHREFFSLDFEVTPDVLIPRPETEQLIVRALDLAKELAGTQPLMIADVGTGSGAIAVSLARHLQHCQITAIDLSPAALAVAQRNAQRHTVAGRIEFLQGDLLDAVPSGSLFHLIVSNPPYVATDELASLHCDVRDHEPHLALDGGRNGTQVIERLIPQAAHRLRSGGWLLLEVGAANAPLVAELVERNLDLTSGETIKDLAGLPRVVQAQKR
jgi:release factor glutamine methyltransferase